MIQQFTKIYDGPNATGLTENLVWIPLLTDGIIREIIVKTDEAVAVDDAFFGGRKNGVNLASLSNVIPVGDKLSSIPGLNVTMAKGDEVVFRLISGAVSSPISFTIVYDDLVSPLVQAEYVLSTASLANLAVETIDDTKGRQLMVRRIETSRAARVRAYSTDAYRTADAARAIGTETAADNYLLEVMTSAAELGANAKQMGFLFNADDPAIAKIYWSIQNLGATGAVEVTIFYTLLEN